MYYYLYYLYFIGVRLFKVSKSMKEWLDLFFLPVYPTYFSPKYSKDFLLCPFGFSKLLQPLRSFIVGSVWTLDDWLKITIFLVWWHCKGARIPRWRFYIEVILFLLKSAVLFEKDTLTNCYIFWLGCIAVCFSQSYRWFVMDFLLANLLTEWMIGWKDLFCFSILTSI